MGNSPPTGGLLLGSGDHTYQANVRGTPAILMFRGREIEEDSGEKITESWKMTYKAGKSTCVFYLSKTNSRNDMVTPHHHDEKLQIYVTDDACGTRSSEFFHVIVQRNEAGLLLCSTISTMHFCSVLNITTSTTNAYGVITETSVDMYGSATRRGLMVIEWKKRRKDERPYMGTLAHYYVNEEEGQDVGLSVAVKKIRVSSGNGQFDFVVDGPEQHPADALAYMFKQVLRTKTWKPTYCPHCASKYIDERISESESDIDNLPAPPSHGQRRNGGRLVSNDGKFKGNNNANTFIRNFINGRKR